MYCVAIRLCPKKGQAESLNLKLGVGTLYAVKCIEVSALTLTFVFTANKLVPHYNNLSMAENEKYRTF